MSGLHGAIELKSAVVTAYPRIHITLVDVGHGTGRKYGGAGFAVEGLTTTVKAKEANNTGLLGPPHFDPGDLADLREAVDRVSDQLNVVFDVSVQCDAPAHSGLGTKTSCVLAVLRACNAVSGGSLSNRDIVKLSNRGGTSGIGVNTTFAGGFVADAGQASDSDTLLLPSSAATGTHETPPVIVRLKVPENWRIHLFLPDGERITGQAERDFFMRSTPIPRWEILEVLASVYHGVAPSFATGNLPGLACSLRRIHEFGFKKREVERQCASVPELLRCLNSVGNLAVGMSSLGPLVYAISALGSEDLTNQFKSRYGSIYLGEFKARNEGGDVRLVESA